jgi:hypothetical protein
MYVIKDTTTEEISYAFEISETDIEAAFAGLIEIHWVSEDEQSTLVFFDESADAYEWEEMLAFEGYEEEEDAEDE